MKNGEGSDIKTSRAYVYMWLLVLSLNAAHVRCTCAASFGDRKEKNDSASEHLENSGLGQPICR